MQKLLSQPFDTGKVRLKNRLVLPPFTTGKADEKGYVTPAIYAHYEEKTRGGCLGLVIVEHCFISQEGKAVRGQLSAAEDGTIEGLSKLADIIKKNGVNVILQINHAGGLAKPSITGREVLCPSVVELPNSEKPERLPSAMSERDIDKVIEDFAKAARRAKLAGFDGVQIHAAHRYLLNQFYSPLTNLRTDKYCGFTLEGRVRLPFHIIRAVREVVGEDFLVSLRLGASDYIEGGSTLQDSLQAVRLFEEAGIDLLDISGGFCRFTRPGMEHIQGYFSELTKEIKKVVTVPVILAGGVTDGLAAERLLEEEAADLIGVCRAIIKDPSWAKRVICEE